MDLRFYPWRWESSNSGLEGDCNGSKSNLTFAPFFYSSPSLQTKVTLEQTDRQTDEHQGNIIFSGLTAHTHYSLTAISTARGTQLLQEWSNCDIYGIVTYMFWICYVAVVFSHCCSRGDSKANLWRTQFHLFLILLPSTLLYTALVSFSSLVVFSTFHHSLVLCLSVCFLVPIREYKTKGLKSF